MCQQAFQLDHERRAQSARRVHDQVGDAREAHHETRRRREDAVNTVRCNHAPTRLYRVKSRSAGPWMFVCPICFARLSENNHAFVLGGVVSNRRRRGRSIGCQAAHQPLPPAASPAVTPTPGMVPGRLAG